MPTPKQTAMTLLTIASNRANYGAGMEALLGATFTQDMLEIGAHLPADASEGDVWCVFGPYLRDVCGDLAVMGGHMVHEYSTRTGVPVQEALDVLRDHTG